MNKPTGAEIKPFCLFNIHLTSLHDPPRVPTMQLTRQWVLKIFLECHQIVLKKEFDSNGLQPTSDGLQPAGDGL